MTFESIIATSSAVIAAAAFFIAAWQGVLMRQHNRLSVRPCLRIDRHEQLGKPISINLNNSGIGPAFIKTFAIRVDGNPLEGNIQTRMHTALGLLGLQGLTFHNSTPFEGEAIAAGENQKLLEVVMHNPELMQTH